jgi:hypothetical protein
MEPLFNVSTGERLRTTSTPAGRGGRCKKVKVAQQASPRNRNRALVDRVYPGSSRFLERILDSPNIKARK